MGARGLCRAERAEPMVGGVDMWMCHPLPLPEWQGMTSPLVGKGEQKGAAWGLYRTLWTSELVQM